MHDLSVRGIAKGVDALRPRIRFERWSEGLWLLTNAVSPEQVAPISAISARGSDGSGKTCPLQNRQQIEVDHGRGHARPG
jgi:hypothetical protein